MFARYSVIQSFLALFPQPRYLEIGVNKGVTFHNLTASKKVAVDPKFLFTTNDREPDAEYHEVTSDVYFLDLRDDEQFDVIYLDGLHTFEQTLRDLLNSICHIRRDGIIIIDDVLPNSYHASLKDLSEFHETYPHMGPQADGSWMGDVYRLVYFIETYLPKYMYATMRENHGQLVMWRGKRTEHKSRDYDVEEICRLEYKDILLRTSSYNFLSLEEIHRARRDCLSSE